VKLKIFKNHYHPEKRCRLNPDFSLGHGTLAGGGQDGRQPSARARTDAKHCLMDNLGSK
jgi:hypothetical protein